LKRRIDVLGALVGLLFLSPVLLVLAALIRRLMGAPVFHCQFQKIANP
jgi:lipopolysaccharide/colanic/teichoic acid biosynthesis glycosyltransferase